MPPSQNQSRSAQREGGRRQRQQSTYLPSYYGKRPPSITDTESYTAALDSFKAILESLAELNHERLLLDRRLLGGPDNGSGDGNAAGIEEEGEEEEAALRLRLFRLDPDSWGGVEEVDAEAEGEAEAAGNDDSEADEDHDDVQYLRQQLTHVRNLKVKRHAIEKRLAARMGLFWACLEDVRRRKEDLLCLPAEGKPPPPPPDYAAAWTALVDEPFARILGGSGGVIEVVAEAAETKEKEEEGEGEGEGQNKNEPISMLPLREDDLVSLVESHLADLSSNTLDKIIVACSVRKACGGGGGSGGGDHMHPPSSISLSSSHRPSAGSHCRSASAGGTGGMMSDGSGAAAAEAIPPPSLRHRHSHNHSPRPKQRRTGRKAAAAAIPPPIMSSVAPQKGVAPKGYRGSEEKEEDLAIGDDRRPSDRAHGRSHTDGDLSSAMPLPAPLRIKPSPSCIARSASDGYEGGFI